MSRWGREASSDGIVDDKQCSVCLEQHRRCLRLDVGGEYVVDICRPCFDALTAEWTDAGEAVKP